MTSLRFATTFLDLLDRLPNAADRERENLAAFFGTDHLAPAGRQGAAARRHMVLAMPTGAVQFAARMPGGGRLRITQGDERLSASCDDSRWRPLGGVVLAEEPACYRFKLAPPRFLERSHPESLAAAPDLSYLEEGVIAGCGFVARPGTHGLDVSIYTRNRDPEICNVGLTLLGSAGGIAVSAREQPTETSQLASIRRLEDPDRGIAGTIAGDSMPWITKVSFDLQEGPSGTEAVELCVERRSQAFEFEPTTQGRWTARRPVGRLDLREEDAECGFLLSVTEREEAGARIVQFSAALADEELGSDVQLKGARQVVEGRPNSLIGTSDPQALNYLAGVARNTRRDMKRRQQNRAQRGSVMLEGDNFEDVRLETWVVDRDDFLCGFQELADALNLAHVRQLAPTILDLIRSLDVPPDYIDVLVGYLLNPGYRTKQEAGEALGFSPGTTSSAFYRIRQALVAMIASKTDGI